MRMPGRARAICAVRLWVELVEQLDEHLEILEVGVEEFLKPRALHLDRDGLALVRGAVDLACGMGMWARVGHVACMGMWACGMCMWPL